MAILENSHVAAYFVVHFFAETASVYFIFRHGVSFGDLSSGGSGPTPIKSGGLGSPAIIIDE
jgi:hypothetical protein